jgi:hypothetical protein
MTPTITSGKENLAAVEATMRSQHEATTSPAPRAGPFIAPITGKGHRRIASKVPLETTDRAIWDFVVRSDNSLTSAPALNIRPAAVKTTQRI